MFDLVLSFVTAFALTYIAIPSIINVSKKKHLFDEPNDRTSHQTNIPTLGGFGIFAGMLFSIILWTPFKFFGDLQYILCSFIILFLIGAKDDIDPVSPIKKFLAQLFAATILVFKANVRITSLDGILGLYEMHFWVSVIVSIFVIVSLINAFNLIDGVNGLAGSISILSSFLFGFWFYKMGRLEFAITAFALVGSVLAFLRFNIRPVRIFMGDTGSLLLGLVASILAINFIELNRFIPESNLHIDAAPSVVVAVLIIPLFDTIRVIAIRLFSGQSPFKPDKNHVHHLLLESGLSHIKTTLVLIAVNALIILIAYNLMHLGSTVLFFIVLGIALFLCIILQWIVTIKKRRAL